MVLIIDGHNLIPRIPGMSLADPEDEAQLIQLLQDYCRVRRKQAEVFFDGAPAGQAGIRGHGLVRAHFVREGMTADDAIMVYLKKLKKRARNVTVVSSDRQVLTAARAVHAQVMTSEDFAAAWADLTQEAPGLDPRERPLSEDEVAQWERLFKDSQPPENPKSYK